MILERLPQVQALSPEEKRQLAEELWEEVDGPEETPKQREAILELLDARFEKYLKDPSSASTWEEVKARLQKR